MQTGLVAIQLLASANEGAEAGLTTGGWMMMLGSIGLVTSLCVFCVVRIFRENKPSEHHHAPLDIDTRDT